MAAALTDALEAAGHEVHSVDMMRSANPVFAAWTERLYELLTRYFPIVYGWSYRLTASLSTRHWLWRVLSVSTRRSAWRAVGDYQPDVVVQLFSDHALRPPIPASLRMPRRLVVLTDYALHSRWFYPSGGAYILPSARLVVRAQREYGVEDPLLALGIPVRREFWSAAEGHCAPNITHAGRDDGGMLDRHDFSCDSRHDFSCDSPPPKTREGSTPYVLVLTGGRGVFPQLKKVVRTLRQERREETVVVLCGRNQTMYDRLNEEFSGDPQVSVRGYLAHVRPLLSGASLVVTKAGGVTIAECLAVGVPLLFFRPTPGQEFENARFVSESGAGILVKNLSQLETALRGLSSDMLAEWRLAAVRLGQPEAATKVVQLLENWQGTEALVGQPETVGQ